MLKENKGFAFMFIAIFLIFGMIIWTSATLKDGKNYIESTHNGASCLDGGWCGGIPVILASLFAFAIAFLLAVHGYIIVEKSRKENIVNIQGADKQ